MNWPTRLLHCFDAISRESAGLAWLAGSAFLYSTMGIFLQRAAVALPSTQLVFIRSVFQGTLVVLTMIVIVVEEPEKDEEDDTCRQDNNHTNEPQTTPSAQSSQSQSPPRQRQRRLINIPFGSTWRVIRIVLLRGLVGGIGFSLYYYTLAALPLGDALSLLSTKAVVCMLLGRVILHEPLYAWHGVVAAASLVGAICIAQPTVLFGNDDDIANATTVNPWGYLTAILGACSSAGVIILIRHAGSVGAHTLQLLASWATFGAVLSCAAAVVFNNQWHWTGVSIDIWINVLGMCVVGSAGHVLLNAAAQMAPAGPAAVVRASDISWGTLWQVVVFGQHPDDWTLTGTALIALSIVVLAIDKMRRNNNSQQQHWTTTTTMWK